MKGLIDISPLLHEYTAVWPGDQKFQRKISFSLEEGHNYALSSITTSLHIGAHADAPSHYKQGAESIEQIDLSPYYGPCQVVHVNIPRGARIQPEDFEDEIRCERVLFRTMSFPNPNEFNEDFNSLSPKLIAFLAQMNCKLIGIDTPSVDPFHSKNLESHHALYEHEICNLEGLVLEHVAAREYILSAFPLALEAADASPVRAVLIEV